MYFISHIHHEIYIKGRMFMSRVCKDLNKWAVTAMTNALSEIRVAIAFIVCVCVVYETMLRQPCNDNPAHVEEVL